MATTDKHEEILARIDRVPLAERARQEILEAILKGRFGDRLPAEEDLAAMLAVSRTTIRSALQGLEAEGIITRRRAIGTTINRHVSLASLALQRMVGFDWLLREQGHEVEIDARHWRAVPPEDVRTPFGLADAEECLLTEKTYRADGKIALHIRDIVPNGSLRSGDVPDDVPASLFEFSRTYCRKPIDHAVARILAAVKGRDTTSLPVADGEPFTRVHETHYARQAEIVAYSIIDVADQFIRLEVFRREAG